MGLFDLFKKQSKQPPQPEATPQPAPAPPRQDLPQSGDSLLDIAAIISEGNQGVLEEVRACMNNPILYTVDHCDRYLARGLTEDSDPWVLQWIGMVDSLELEGYVCERDWKDELEDFVHFLQTRRGTERLGLTLDPKWLDQKGDVASWCDTLNQHWAAQGCCAATIGIDSDSYVLFPCTLAERDHLGALAKELGECIE